MILNTILFLCLFSAVEIQNNGYIEGDLKVYKILDNEDIINLEDYDSGSENRYNIANITSCSYSRENSSERLFIYIDYYENTGDILDCPDRFRNFMIIDYVNDNGIYKILRSQYYSLIYDDFYIKESMEFVNGSISTIDNGNERKEIIFDINYSNNSYKKRITSLKGRARVILNDKVSEKYAAELKYSILIQLLMSQKEVIEEYLPHLYWIDLDIKKRAAKNIKVYKGYEKKFKKLEVQDDGTIVVEYNNDK